MDHIRKDIEVINGEKLSKWTNQPEASTMVPITNNKYTEGTIKDLCVNLHILKNKFGKTVKVDSPYAIYKNEATNFEHRVLKTYQTKEKESKNPYARWYVASRSPYTYL